ncbi:MAG: response regulator [Candidatus Omnitrophota bacterium]|nr:response regulator [Candidatus Omnitrophota bacterium]
MIKNILIVDDDPVQIRFLSERLSHNGYQVVSALEAAEGLQLAMDQQPDLILLDVMMPIINGYNFCHLLKFQKDKKNIPIILVTARDDEEDIKIGMEMGADAYIIKPVEIKSLIHTIKLLETKGQERL